MSLYEPRTFAIDPEQRTAVQLSALDKRLAAVERRGGGSSGGGGGGTGSIAGGHLTGSYPNPTINPASRPQVAGLFVGGTDIELSRPAAGVLQMGRIGAGNTAIRIVPGTGGTAAVTLFDDIGVGRWALYRDTNDKFRLRDSEFTKYPITITPASSATGGPITNLSGKFTLYGPPTDDYTNEVFDLAGNLDSSHITARTGTTGANRFRLDTWTEPDATGGTNGLRNARNGTITITGGGVDVASSVAAFTAADVNKKINALRTPGGTYVEYYTGTISAYIDTQHVTLSPGFGADYTALPFAVDPDDVGDCGDASTGYGNQYASFQGALKSQNFNKGYGSYNPIGIQMTVYDDVGDGSDGTGLGQDGYTEASYFAGHAFCHRRGALVGGEVGVWVDTDKRGRCSPWWAILTDHNSYSSYNVTNPANVNYLGATSPWRRTGGRGMWILGGSSLYEEGTGLWISGRPAGGWKRYIVANHASTGDLAGTDVFTVAGSAFGLTAGNGSVGIGAFAGVHHDSADGGHPSGLTATLVIAPSATPTTAAEGMQFGIAPGQVNVYRTGTSGAPNLHISSSLSIGGSLLNVSAGRIFTDGLAFGATNITSANSPYIMTVDSGHVVADTTSGNISVTLPLASTPGQLVFIEKKVTANTLTLNRASSDMIEDDTSLLLTNRYSRAFLIADGAGTWYRLSTNPVDGFGVGLAIASGGGAPGIWMSPGGQMDMQKGTGSLIRNYTTPNTGSPVVNPTLQVLPSGEYRMGPVGGATGVDVGIARNQTLAGVLHVTDGTTAGFGELRAKCMRVVGTGTTGFLTLKGQTGDVAAPTAPGADTVALYSKVVAGVTQLCARFDNGVVRVLAVESP